jgi:hypothetical protein
MRKTIEMLGLLTLLDDRGVAWAGAGPAELLQTCKPEEVGRRRSLFCPAYDRCLDAALGRRWRSWTCEECRFYPQARPFRALAASRAGVMRPHGPSCWEAPDRSRP